MTVVFFLLGCGIGYPANGLFKESRPNSLGSDSSNWLLNSIIHNRPSPDYSRALSATSCLPAIRWSDGDS